MELSILPSSILTLLLNLMVIVNLSGYTVRFSEQGKSYICSLFYVFIHSDILMHSRILFVQ